MQEQNLNALGIRVEPKKTTFVILKKDGPHFELLNCEIIKVPSALEFPEQLKYIRTCVLDILREYDVEKAGIRVAEGNSRNLDIKRLHIEGVIQESFSSSNVISYFTGRKASMAKRIGLSISEMDDIIGNKDQLPNLIGCNLLKNKEYYEAAIVAMGAEL